MSLFFMANDIDIRDANRVPSLLAISTTDYSTLKLLTAIDFSSGANTNALTVAIVDGSGSQITSFGGGTQYTDGGVTPTHPIGTMPVYDNGGTISKVGTSNGLPVQQQGTWNIGTVTTLSQFPATQTLSDSIANPTVTGIAAYMLGLEGTTYARIKSGNTLPNTSATGFLNTLAMGKYNASGVSISDGTKVVLQLDSAANLLVNVNAALPSGTNVIGHVIADSGSTTAVTQATASSLNATIVGNKTNNNAAPGATNIGALVAIANASAPSYTEGDQVLLSTDLSGSMRTSASFSPPNDVTASGSLTSTTSVTTATLNGSSTITVYISGTWSATVQFEASTDGTNYFSVNAMPILGGTAVTSTTANGEWTIASSAYANVRARVSAYTSGTVVIAIRSSTGASSVELTSPLPAGANILGQIKILGNSGATLDAAPGSTPPTNVLYVGGKDGFSNLIHAFGVQEGQGDASDGKPFFPSALWGYNGTTYDRLRSVGTGILNVGIADGSGNELTSNSTTYTSKHGLDVNLLGTLGTAFSTAGKVDITGTVTANIGAQNGLALDSSVNGLLLPQGGTTSGQDGPLVQGAVTTSAPTYTTAEIFPLSLNTSGGLRVDGSGVTQPVSGTVTANAGTGTFNIQSNASVNLAQIAGASTATSHGTASGSLRVELPTDGTGVVGLNAGSNLVGKVGIDQTTVGSTNAVTPVPASNSGWSFNYQSALSSTKAQIKGTAGTFGGYLWLYNPNTAVTYIQVFNKASSSVTVGSTTPDFVIALPGVASASATGSAANMGLTIGIAMSTGITVAATTTATGSTAPANALTCTFLYL